jgi:hypothetical protein
LIPFNGILKQVIDICINFIVVSKQPVMHNIIAASFFQKKNCVLPGIGKLSLITHAAVTDFTNKQIKAPVQEIIFAPSATDEKVFNEFSAISELIKKELDETGKVEMEGVGVFSKDDLGNIQFAPVQLEEHLQMPVTAIRVIREHAQHSMLVGDKETTNTAMSEILNEEEPAKDKWWIWAIVLGATALLLLAVYLYQHGNNGFANVGQ